MDNVNNWHIFKTVCAKTQNKLQSLIKKDGSLLEEVGYFWIFHELSFVHWEVY